MATKPTIEEIQGHMNQIAADNSYPAYENPSVDDSWHPGSNLMTDDGALIGEDNEILTAAAILAAWDSITPGTCDGLIMGEVEAKVFGAYDGEDLWLHGVHEPEDLWAS